MGNTGEQREERGTRRVVGLHYERGELPTLVFKASGEQADEILRQRRHVIGAPLVRDPRLTHELYRLPVDAPIGRKLFVAVAAVLVHVLSLEAAMEERSDA